MIHIVFQKADADALKKAIDEELIESKEPMLLCFDVLIQFCCTLAISDGFTVDELFNEVKKTFLNVSKVTAISQTSNNHPQRIIPLNNI